MIVAADYSSIESVVLGWLTGCKLINDLHAKGLDPYKVFASLWFGARYDEVTPAMRNLAKPPDLGCGYGLSAVGKKGDGGLYAYARSMGVELTMGQCSSAVLAWRKTHPEVVNFWTWIDEALIKVIALGQEVTGYRLRLWLEHDFFMVGLPDGSQLYYYQPQCDPDEGFSYMGQDTFTHQWTRIRSWGSRMTENFVQAIAAIVLGDHMLAFEAEHPGLLIGHVHDEPITEAPAEHAETCLRNLLGHMTTRLWWAPGMVLRGHGYVARRYRKD